MSNETLADRIKYLRECAAEDGILPNETSLAFAEVLCAVLPDPSLFLHENGNFSISIYPAGHIVSFEVEPLASTDCGVNFKGAMITRQSIRKGTP